MKPILLLHCGMEKTGSSFLQTMFVRNRGILSSKGIYYPKSEKELDMVEGRITAGNGIHLSRILTKKKSEVNKLLSADLADANKLNLDRILYSSELLFNQFAEDNAFKNLCSAARDVGYGDIRALIYFRDPVSHTLSTYKHRAKYGDYPDFQSWLQRNYNFFDLIGAFLEYSKDPQVQWSCRKYKSDSAYMVKSSFLDWLDTDAPEIPEDDQVNSSLTLNELRVLQCFKKEYPGCENFLREAFLSLQAKDKKNEKDLKDEYSYLIAEKWHHHESLLDACNTMMCEGEKLTIKSVNKSSKNESFTSLSEKQLQAVTDGMKSYLNAQKLKSKMMDALERGAKKIKRKWVASRIVNKFLE